MRKYMNNHYGYSRLFRHARFATDPAVSVGDESVDGNGIDIDVSGGGSPSKDNDDSEGSESLEAIKAELARARADNERYKNSISKLNKEKGELTKQNREMMSADQLAQEAQKEREKRFAEMEKELRTNKYSKRLVGVGMTEAEADDFAAKMPEIEDVDGFFNTLGNFIKAREKTAADKAIQDLLKSRPDIHAGNGNADKDDPAMALAKQSVSQRKDSNYGRVDENILNYYTYGR